MSSVRLFANTSNLLRVKLWKVSTGLPFTGLAFGSSLLVIGSITDNEATATAYTQAGGTIETITTLGTFAAPTATKCRFKEVDATNHPGLYEIQLADARFAIASSRQLVITISGVADLATADYEIDLVRYNPQDATNLGLSKVTSLTFTSAGKVDANTLLVEGSDATDQIRDSILSDATRFAGADIAAIKGFVDTEIATIITNLAAVKTVVDSIDGHTDTEISSIISTLSTILGLIDTEVAAIKIVTDKFVFTVGNQVDANALTVGDKTGYALTADFRIKKNTALASFPFPMKDAAGALVSGVTVTTTRSINGAAFGASANAASEIAGTGIYLYSFAAADLNGDTIAVKFAAPGCVDRYVTIVTQTE